jgi:hypothetical protein
MANPNDVKKELDKLFDALAKKGMLKGANKKELVDTVMESIEKAGTMAKLDLSNPALLKTLSIALTSALVMKLDPKANLKLDLLFKDNLKPEEKDEVKKILTTVNKFLPKDLQLSDKELDKVFDDITKKKNTDKDNDNQRPSMEQDNSNALDSATLFLQILLNTPNPYQITGGSFVPQSSVGDSAAIPDQNAAFTNDELSQDTKTKDNSLGQNKDQEMTSQEHEETPKEVQTEQEEQEHHKPKTPFDGMKNNTPFSH